MPGRTTDELVVIRIEWGFRQVELFTGLVEFGPVHIGDRACQPKPPTPHPPHRCG